MDSDNLKTNVLSSEEWCTWARDGYGHVKAGQLGCPILTNVKTDNVAIGLYSHFNLAYLYV